MKKIITLLLSALVLTFLVGCETTSNTSSKSTSSINANEENEKLTDADFIVNISKGLEARWTYTDSDEYSDEALDAMSISEKQNAHYLFVNAELDAIGSLDEYKFEDSDLKALAEQYIKGLELQKEGVQYIGTDNSTEYEQTYTLGWNYRAVTISDLYKEYGLTVSDKFQSTLNDFIAESDSAKKSIAIQDYVNELASTLTYEKDEEKSDAYSTYYKAVIENTTEYSIDNLEIEIDFIDASGVVIYQTTDYLQNVKSGSKVQSSIYYDQDMGEWTDMDFIISSYE